jgi:hypothetical protein
MSLDKAIKHNKEKRKQYYDSRAWDSSCRCHGSCSYCSEGRTRYKRVEETIEKEQLEEYFCYWGMRDPADPLEEVTFERLKELGVDPWDFDAVRELDV